MDGVARIAGEIPRSVKADVPRGHDLCIFVAAKAFGGFCGQIRISRKMEYRLPPPCVVDVTLAGSVTGLAGVPGRGRAGNILLAVDRCGVALEMALVAQAAGVGTDRGKAALGAAAGEESGAGKNEKENNCKH